jgi:hypothetical protein
MGGVGPEWKEIKAQHIIKDLSSLKSASDEQKKILELYFEGESLCGIVFPINFNPRLRTVLRLVILCVDSISGIKILCDMHEAVRNLQVIDLSIRENH